MSSAWLLPEHVCDVLPAEARRIEELRRDLLDAARSVEQVAAQRLDAPGLGRQHIADMRILEGARLTTSTKGRRLL